MQFLILFNIRNFAGNMLVHKVNDFVIRIIIQLWNILYMESNVEVHSSSSLELLFGVIIENLANGMWCANNYSMEKPLEHIVNMAHCCHRVPLQPHDFSIEVLLIYIFLSQRFTVLLSNSLNNFCPSKFCNGECKKECVWTKLSYLC